MFHGLPEVQGWSPYPKAGGTTRQNLQKKHQEQGTGPPPLGPAPQAGERLLLFQFSVLFSFLFKKKNKNNKKKASQHTQGLSGLIPNTIITLLPSFIVQRRCEISHFPQFYRYNIHNPDSCGAFPCYCSLSAALFKSFLTRIVIQHLSPLPSHVVVGGVLFV